METTRRTNHVVRCGGTACKSDAMGAIRVNPCAGPIAEGMVYYGASCHRLLLASPGLHTPLTLPPILSSPLYVIHPVPSPLPGTLTYTGSGSKCSSNYNMDASSLTTQYLSLQVVDLKMSGSGPMFQMIGLRCVPLLPYHYRADPCSSISTPAISFADIAIQSSPQARSTTGTRSRAAMATTRA